MKISKFRKIRKLSKEISSLENKIRELYSLIPPYEDRRDWWSKYNRFSVFESYDLDERLDKSLRFIEKVESSFDGIQEAASFYKKNREHSKNKESVLSQNYGEEDTYYDK